MDNTQFILTALRQTEMFRIVMQRDCAMQWIRRYLLNDEKSVAVVVDGALFVGWWKNQWALRDQQYLYETSLRRFELPLDPDTIYQATELYYDIHDPFTLKAIPNKYVRQEIIFRLREEDLKIKAKLKNNER